MDAPDPTRRSAAGEEAVRAKAALRRAIRRGRREREARVAEDAARTAALTRWLAGLTPLEVVACYLSVGTEPDTTALLAWLWRRGARVIVPTLGRAEDGTWCPAWAHLEPDEPLRLVRGLPEPADPVPCPEGLRLADVILVPGLAATWRGDRLGQGAGWYDRALLARRPHTPVCLLLGADEVLAWLPTEAHDQPVDWLATPDGVGRAKAWDR